MAPLHRAEGPSASFTSEYAWVCRRSSLRPVQDGVTACAVVRSLSRSMTRSKSPALTRWFARSCNPRDAGAVSGKSTLRGSAATPIGDAPGWDSNPSRRPRLAFCSTRGRVECQTLDPAIPLECACSADTVAGALRPPALDVVSVSVEAVGVAYKLALVGNGCRSRPRWRVRRKHRCQEAAQIGEYRLPVSPDRGGEE